ncbi:hypothetical protein [Parasphingorhabdus cellanae]|uniref:Uncharacterized protein n=1 Tax=Parasphingorhabdus cellanae TaxID=2806553 RepID=A0ABX7T1C9_9SPHN|nr:hypothetical protein [Parasphingorhabdus cellanae]QTD55374.1 hypothetical protein J4G78_14330 [Parasphingorhabdus cellanae]
MTQPPEKSEDPIYIADPAKEKQAKTLHFMVSIIRLLGIAILMLGIAISLGRLGGIPAAVGYVLVVIGLAQTWILPITMVRSFVKRQVAEEADKEAADEKIL